MMWVLRGPSPRKSGFTLVETAVSLAIFSALGYALAIVVDVGDRSQRTVERVASEDRSLRTATSSLVEELRTTSDATIAVATLPDGNHQVRFQQPIDVGGNFGWGVLDRTLGSDPASQNRAGWSIQYTVRTVVAADGQVDRQLVRQVLNDALVVQRQTVLAAGLRRGDQNPPGFRMVRSGDVWEVQISAKGQVADQAIIEGMFHVQARN